MQTAPDVERLSKIKPGTVLLPRLRKIREDRELSIRELAKKAKLTPDTVWRVEKLQRGAEPKTRRQLAKALGVGVKDLRKTEEADD